MTTVTEIGAPRQRRVSRVPASVKALYDNRRPDPKDLAAALGCGVSTLYKKLKGEAPMTIEEAEAAAEFFAVPLSVLSEGFGGFFGPQGNEGTARYLPVTEPTFAYGLRLCA